MLTTSVYLEDIAEELEIASDESSTYYNTENGEFEYYNEDFSNIDKEEFENEKYIALPSQHDVNEYDMMVEFADTVKDGRKSELLAVALEGRGAFRRFKDTLFRVELVDEWYKFKNEAYIEVARDWCEGYGIPYKVKNSGNTNTTGDSSRTSRIESHNMLMAALTGAEVPENMPRQITLLGADGKEHTFAIECLILQRCKSINAIEICGATCYKESICGELEDSFDDMWHKMASRLEKALSKKYICDDGSMEDFKVVGYIEQSDVNGMHEVIIDGKPYTWLQLGNNLMAYEGWKIKIEFAPMSDELE